MTTSIPAWSAEVAPAERHFRIALVTNAPLTTEMRNAFQKALEAQGYASGRNLEIDARHIAGRAELVPRLVTELLQQKPDVIVVGAGGAATRAAMDVAGGVPIVMVDVGDPVGIGLVASLREPGGNVTGIATLQVDLIPKRLELIRETLPNAARVAVLLPPRGSFGATWSPAAVEERAAAARGLGLTLIPIEVKSTMEFGDAAAEILRERPDAMLVGAHVITNSLVGEIASLATKHRIPTFACCKSFARGGALMTYGPSPPDEYRMAAAYVGRILRGDKPAALPVLQPQKFELIINGGSAKRLGIAVPQSLQLRADEVLP